MKVSIITANYNNEHTLQMCLESVSQQTYADIEHIVIDGASTDGSMKLIESHSNAADIKYFSSKDNGIYDALNKGIAKATGDIIGILHSDDVFAHSEVIENIVSQFESKDCDGVYGDLHYFKGNSPLNIIRNWVSKPFKNHLLKQGWMPPHPTLYLKSKVYHTNGFYKSNYKIAADYDFMINLFSQSQLKFSYVPEVFVKMRTGGISNSSLKNIITKSMEDYKILKENNFKNPLYTLTLKNLSKVKQFVK